MFRTSLLLCGVIICMTSLDAKRLPTPLNLGNGGVRLSMINRRNAEFGEGVRDWFKNMRDKIFGKDTSNQMKSTSPFLFDSSPMTSILKNSMETERMMIQPTNFFLDLSTLKFDPTKDWGFHMGKWYIIRKSDSRDEWDENWNDFFESTSEADNDTNEEILRSPKPDTSISSKKQIQENETTNDASVEVLKPTA